LRIKVKGGQTALAGRVSEFLETKRENTDILSPCTAVDDECPWMCTDSDRNVVSEPKHKAISTKPLYSKRYTLSTKCYLGARRTTTWEVSTQWWGLRRSRHGTSRATTVCIEGLGLKETLHRFRVTYLSLNLDP